jgi:hypothetical protein
MEHSSRKKTGSGFLNVQYAKVYVSPSCFYPTILNTTLCPLVSFLTNPIRVSSFKYADSILLHLHVILETCVAVPSLRVSKAKYDFNKKDGTVISNFFLSADNKTGCDK